MIRQNRAVPILLVLTFAWVLYLGGCFGAEELPTEDLSEPEPTVAPTSTPERVVTDAAANVLSQEEPLIYTIEDGDLLQSIATKFSVSPAVILRANPDLDADFYRAGDKIRIPGATTVNTLDEDLEAAREAGESISHVIEAGDNFGVLSEIWTVTVDALAEANPGLDPSSLQIGDLIEIPPKGSGYSAEELASFTRPTCAEREPGEVLRHQVEVGDSISELADFYSVTRDELVAANVMQDENQLAVGTELVIPPPTEGTSGC